MIRTTTAVRIVTTVAIIRIITAVRIVMNSVLSVIVVVVLFLACAVSPATANSYYSRDDRLDSYSRNNSGVSNFAITIYSSMPFSRSGCEIELDEVIDRNKYAFPSPYPLHIDSSSSNDSYASKKAIVFIFFHTAKTGGESVNHAFDSLPEFTYDRVMYKGDMNS